MNVEDEEEDDNVEEDDVEEENQSQEKHTLCEPAPAQSKCTWTGHKSHFVWTVEITRKMDGDISGNAHVHFTRAI